MNQVRKYLKGANDVAHTTINPNGPGAVRIHLVPPQRPRPGVPWAVILNGQDVLPLNTSWAVLLREFILTVNEHSGEELCPEDVKEVVRHTLRRMKAIYPKAPEDDVRKDLAVLLETLNDIARGKAPGAETGFMTLAQYAPYMRAPHRMDLMISAMRRDGRWNCNQRCLHCYAADQPLGERPELDTEGWKEIIDRCREACIPQLTFTGGEPTLRQDLPELVAYASWFVTRLNTNGILLTKELCARLREASLDSVQITLYDRRREAHNRLVGAEQFDRTVEGIGNAVAAGLNVSVNTPLCTLNADYFDTLNFAADLGVKYFSCSGLIPSGGAAGEDSRATRLDEKALQNALSRALGVCRQRGLELSFTSPGWLDDAWLSGRKLTVPSCGACLSNMAVASDGSVVPCQSWLSGEPLGNLLTQDWKSIWDSAVCRAVRDRAVGHPGVCLLKATLRGE